MKIRAVAWGPSVDSRDSVKMNLDNPIKTTGRITISDIELFIRAQYAIPAGWRLVSVSKKTV
jgi:hypothetical protein